ncbi:MAG: hypothetical protein ABJB95_07160, partial [Gemmatimonadales bacterium]
MCVSRAPPAHRRVRRFALLALSEEPQRCQRSLDGFGASDESALDADCVSCQANPMAAMLACAPLRVLSG